MTPRSKTASGALPWRTLLLALLVAGFVMTRPEPASVDAAVPEVAEEPETLDADSPELDLRSLPVDTSPASFTSTGR